MTLEQLLQGPPSEEAFFALCDQLATAKADDPRLAEAAAVVQTWDEILRALPYAWALRLLDGEPTPAAAVLCDFLDLESGSFGATEATNLAASPLLAQLTSIGLNMATVSDAAIEILAASPAASGLQMLDLLFAEDVTDVSAHAIARSPHLSDLGSLCLTGTRITADGVEALVSSPNLPGLHQLMIDDCGDRGVAAIVGDARLVTDDPLVLRDMEMGDLGAQAIAASPHLSGLKTLDVGSNRIGPAGAGALVRGLPSLTALLMGRNHLGDDGVAAIAAERSASRLRVLELMDNRLGDEAAVVLARSPYLRGLTRLWLYNNNGIGPFGARAIARARWPALEALSLTTAFIGAVGTTAIARARFPALKRLELSYSRAGPEGIAALAEAAFLPQLTHLDASGNNARNDGVVPLIGADRLRRLESLALAANGLADDAAQAIAEASLPNLKRLHLGANNIGDAGAVALAGSPNLAGLVELELGQNPIGSAGRAALAASPYLPERLRQKWRPRNKRR